MPRRRACQTQINRSYVDTRNAIDVGDVSRSTPTSADDFALLADNPTSGH